MRMYFRVLFRNYPRWCIRSKASGTSEQLDRFPSTELRTVSRRSISNGRAATSPAESPANMAKEDGASAKSRSRRIDGAGADSRSSVAARAGDSAIRGFLRGGKWPPRVAGSCLAVSRFVDDTTTRSVAGGVRASAGNCIDGNPYFRQGQTAGGGSQRRGDLPAEISFGAGEAAELECRRRAGLPVRSAHVRGFVT